MFNATESAITDYITTLIQQNVLIIKPKLKGDTYFVVSKNDNLNNDSVPDDEI